MLREGGPDNTAGHATAPLGNDDEHVRQLLIGFVGVQAADLFLQKTDKGGVVDPKKMSPKPPQSRAE